MGLARITHSLERFTSGEEPSQVEGPRPTQPGHTVRYANAARGRPRMVPAQGGPPSTDGTFGPKEVGSHTRVCPGTPRICAGGNPGSEHTTGDKQGPYTRGGVHSGDNKSPGAYTPEQDSHRNKGGEHTNSAPTGVDTHQRDNPCCGATLLCRRPNKTQAPS